MRFVCDFLAHEFPRIRCIAAEKLYVRLLEANLDIDETHAAVDLLLHHSWESDEISQEIHMNVATDIFKSLGPEDAAAAQEET